MLQVLFVRLPGVSSDLSRPPLAALHRQAGEALTRHFLLREGRDHRQEICRGAHGKPYFAAENGLYFNISHSGDLVVAAFSDREVGIDIERRGRPRLAVAERFFHPREVSRLRAVPAGSLLRLFADYWSVKESFLKYLGTGLSRSLSTFRVEMDAASISLYENDTRLPLHLHPCPVDDAYSCFACSESPVPPLVEEIPRARLRVDNLP
ncbi:MAG: 4'-phosphopantetheinyl transferase superfamily protein [Odoribacteraceae bacterium]|jgi:4'-phosphopantetheinyl transferase|nr:4'-phosphopantetheinyl transferase superfamily protein [Odoribacteraceae bacterium]